MGRCLRIYSSFCFVIVDTDFVVYGEIMMRFGGVARGISFVLRVCFLWRRLCYIMMRFGISLGRLFLNIYVVDRVSILFGVGFAI
jgi:hypothetical protein